MLKFNGEVINPLAAYTFGDVQIPAGTLMNWRESFAAWGITEEDDPVVVRGDDRFYWDGDMSRPIDLATLKASALERIKTTRQNTLDQFTKSAGVAAVYDENLLAAQRFTATDVTPMRGGQTPEQYLLAMGSKLGMTAPQFAAYVITENSLAARKAAAVEAVYLAFAYGRLVASTFESIQTLDSEYQAAIQEALATK